MKKKHFSFYKEHPKKCDPEDFWGQVKRTVNGVPVSQDQINLIVNAILEGLELNKNDTLLDLCCGNGALSTLIFKNCKGGIGVDFSEYLISVACKNFEKLPHVKYLLKDVVDFCENPIDANKFTKVLCYGSFSYIESQRAEKLLVLLKSNFPNLKRVFIGNLPDKDLLHDFIRNNNFIPGTENDPESPIGIWRSKTEFLELASRSGWETIFHKMPDRFYAAHYRYDIILK
jgi:SAM-dependent methyltransferase